MLVSLVVSFGGRGARLWRHPDIWPFISIVNVWLPIEWCGIDGVYK